MHRIIEAVTVGVLVAIAEVVLADLRRGVSHEV